MKCVFIPLDERPCNTEVVYRLASTNKNIELLAPEQELLGLKKEKADTEKLWDWLHKTEATDGIVLSTEMMLYGGLIPSRLHDYSNDVINEFENHLRRLKKEKPNTKIYASSIIMRTPTYSSDDEEPHYYEEFGESIFRRAYYQDKENREGLTDEEQKILQQIKETLPTEYVEDYEKRRAFNSSVNQLMVKLLHDGILDMLVIPQDDSAEYGYTAQDQMKVRQTIAELDMEEKAYVYPGSDEVGATLLTRLYHDIEQLNPKVFVEWSSTLGPQLVPMYEDRPFNEALKQHIRAMGAILTTDKDEADLVLAYNVPGRVMQEAWDQFEKRDPTYDGFRDMSTFADKIEQHLAAERQVAIADCAYANGGDYALIKRLDLRNLLHRLVSYKGWNTNANTLGTTLAQGLLAEADAEAAKIIEENTHYHLIDDFVYQSVVRMRMTDEDLPKRGLNYFDLKSESVEINQLRDHYLTEVFQSMIPTFSQRFETVKIQSYAPWNRMFEVGLVLEA